MNDLQSNILSCFQFPSIFQKTININLAVNQIIKSRYRSLLVLQLNIFNPVSLTIMGKYLTICQFLYFSCRTYMVGMRVGLDKSVIRQPDTHTVDFKS